MEQKGGSWSYDDLNIYLYNPRHFVPGTKMSFAGIKDDKERADLIAYLRQETDNPPPIPDAPAASPEKPVEKPAVSLPAPAIAASPVSAPQPIPEHSSSQEDKR